MAVHNIEISTENLLNAVARMSAKEFEQFIEKAKRLHQKSPKSDWRKGEISLIKKINESTLSAEEQKRFYELIEKRQTEKIKSEELEELIKLTDKSESLNVERIKNLIKLAKSRNVSLDEIISQLGIVTPETI